LSALTEDQLLAATATADALYLEAAPGSGKTTVAAHRFGVQRYGRRYRADPRGVVAVSFTRSATWELRTRVRRLWGLGAVRMPHRILTLDALICDLLHVLLATNHIAWPGGHIALDVRDTWKALVATSWSNRQAFVVVVDGRVDIQAARVDATNRPTPADIRSKMEDGICTHEEVRTVLEYALAQAPMREALVSYLGASIRSLIVDEVFDANPLDLDVVQLARDAGADVTLIGDPWQALYRFRGARPELVPTLVEHNKMLARPLSQSFRWRSDSQAKLARQLRAGEPTTLPPAAPGQAPDVVLATEWKHLWDLDARILPLAFGAAKGNIEEAGATLLLDFASRSLLGVSAVYAGEAFSTLRIEDPLAVGRLDARWPDVIDKLRQPGDAGPKAAYVALVALLATECDTTFRAVRANYTNRLGWLRKRLEADCDVILGMTVHQAKGREWNAVGVALQSTHVSRLGGGLSVSESVDRALYVACTRARFCTFAVHAETR
jgi:DNA helicase-2/ATP-dependent DNA helicase PcrA